MLTELAVSDLGVIGELSLVLGPGMTAVTGETGAGKTLVVEAIELLMSAVAPIRRWCATAPPRPWSKAGSTSTGPRRWCVASSRADGRSRAYVDDRLATAGSLAELGRALVDLHGQHAHQSLLASAVQRDALDRFGGVDLGPLLAARKALHAVEHELAELGGDERARARELDLLRFQVSEIGAAGLVRSRRGRAARRRSNRCWPTPWPTRRRPWTPTRASAATTAPRPAWPRPWPPSRGGAPSPSSSSRLRGIEAELADVASEVRAVGDSIEDDPERLAEVQERRRLLHELRRKYGEHLLAVMDFHAEASARLAQLERP